VPAPGLAVPFGFLLAEGSASWDWSFKLKNQGRAAFTVQSCQSANPAFSLSAPVLPQTLAPNEGKEFTMRFALTQTGLYQDSLSFAIAGQDTSTVHTIRVSAGALVSTDPLVCSLYSRALAAYDSAKAYNPSSEATHNNLGVVLTVLNAAQEASAEFAQSSKKGTQMNRGAVNAIKKEYQQALSLWSNLLANVETQSYIKPQLKYNMAWVYDEIDSLARAYQYYTEVSTDALANARLKAKAYLGRGVTVFKTSRDTSAANADFRQAIALDPHGAGILARENIQALLTGVGDQSLAKPPEDFALSQNYPNPFNPETTIKYAVSSLCRVRIEIYNTLGQRLRTLVDEDQPAGYYTVRWDGKDEQGRAMPSGVYVYTLQAGEFVQVRKMVVVK